MSRTYTDTPEPRYVERAKNIDNPGPEIPTPAASDAGKVLKVGEDLSYELGGGADIPEPTVADAGKLLKVGADLSYELGDARLVIANDKDNWTLNETITGSIPGVTVAFDGLNTIVLQIGVGETATSATVESDSVFVHQAQISKTTNPTVYNLLMKNQEEGTQFNFATINGFAITNTTHKICRIRATYFPTLNGDYNVISFATDNMHTEVSNRTIYATIII